MGKKSAADLVREDFFRRAAKRRDALGGPFRCPKCHTDHAMSCQAKVKDIKQSYVNSRGEEKVKYVSRVTYVLKCQSCWFTRVTRSFNKPSIIDEYNRVYDEELPENIAKELRSNVKPLQRGTIFLPDIGKIRMRK